MVNKLVYFLVNLIAGIIATVRPCSESKVQAVSLRKRAVTLIQGGGVHDLIINMYKTKEISKAKPDFCLALSF